METKLMKNNLLIIPSGPSALFQTWGSYSQYNFDLAVINWSGETLTNLEDAAYVENTKGQKWKIVGEFANKNDLSNYEYIWVMDDDCLTTFDNIEATFNFCKENNLDLAQPALTSDSYRTHPQTFLIHGAKMHITTSVEIMAPIFSRSAWPDCSAHFTKMPLGVGYGLEGYWSEILQSASGTTKFGGRVAVIDTYPVKHTKPVTGPADYARMGIDPGDDGRYLQSLGFGWSFDTIEVIGV
jgi:hypothetical protein